MGTNGANQIKFPINETAEYSATTVEIKIKTLDSQSFSLRVDKSVSVPELKRHIASLTGVLSDEQRLIFRGRVLKDDQLLSAYHVEDGHTLHLVVRQPNAPVQGASADAGATDTSFNSSNEFDLGTLFGNFNVLENLDEGYPDLNRIVSAVLNTVGITRLGSSVEGVDLQHSPLELLSTAPRRMSSGQTASTVESMQLPTIPDSLSTLSQYLSHLTQEFIAHDFQNTGLPVNAGFEVGGGLNTSESRRPFLPETLSVVMLSTRDLLLGQASECLQGLARQLGSQSSITDHLERSTIQSRALRSGAIFQNMGALLLELGRAIMTLRMGQTPADALVNAGPPFFISSAGPNQIMVQSLPLQPGGSVPIPDFPSRNIDIRIRTGSFMPRREPTSAQTQGQVGISSGTSQQDAALSNTNSVYRVSTVDPEFSSSNGNGIDSSRDPTGTFHPVFAMSQHSFSGNVNGSTTSQPMEHHARNGDITQTNHGSTVHGSSDPPSGNRSLPSQADNAQGFSFQNLNCDHEQLANPYSASQSCTTNEESSSIISDDAVLLSHVLRHLLPLISNDVGTGSSFPISEETKGNENPSTHSSSHRHEEMPKQPNPKRHKRD